MHKSITSAMLSLLSMLMVVSCSSTSVPFNDSEQMISMSQEIESLESEVAALKQISTVTTNSNQTDIIDSESKAKSNLDKKVKELQDERDTLAVQLKEMTASRNELIDQVTDLKLQLDKKTPISSLERDGFVTLDEFPLNQPLSNGWSDQVVTIKEITYDSADQSLFFIYDFENNANYSHSSDVISFTVFQDGIEVPDANIFIQTKYDSIEEVRQSKVSFGRESFLENALLKIQSGFSVTNMACKLPLNEVDPSKPIEVHFYLADIKLLLP